MSVSVTFTSGGEAVAFESPDEAYRAAVLVTNPAADAVPWDKAFLSAAKALYAAKLVTKQWLSEVVARWGRAPTPPLVTYLTTRPRVDKYTAASNEYGDDYWESMLDLLLIVSSEDTKTIKQRVSDEWRCDIDSEEKRVVALRAIKQLQVGRPHTPLCNEAHRRRPGLGTAERRGTGARLVLLCRHMRVPAARRPEPAHRRRLDVPAAPEARRGNCPKRRS